MSGKSARLARQQLAGYKLPALIIGDAIRKVGQKKRIETTQVEGDHGRRIRRRSRSQRLTVKESIKRYIKKVGMIPMPKL